MCNIASEIELRSGREPSFAKMADAVRELLTTGAYARQTASEFETILKRLADALAEAAAREC